MPTKLGLDLWLSLPFPFFWFANSETWPSRVIALSPLPPEVIWLYIFRTSSGPGHFGTSCRQFNASWKHVGACLGCFRGLRGAFFGASKYHLGAMLKKSNEPCRFRPPSKPENV